jgi:hypothetical protein
MNGNTESGDPGKERTGTDPRPTPTGDSERVTGVTTSAAECTVDVRGGALGPLAYSVNPWADRDLPGVDVELDTDRLTFRSTIEPSDARDLAALLVQAAERAEEMAAAPDAPSEE